MQTIPEKLEILFQEAARAQIGSGYAAAWGKAGQGAHLNTLQSQLFCGGKVSHAPGALPVTAQTFFDLSSLTKIVSTTSIVMVLVEQGYLDLHAPLEFYLPQECKQHPHLKNLTLTELLSHTSGLLWWKPFYEELRNRFGSNLPFVSTDQRKEYFYSHVLATPPETPAGEKAVYSDIGVLVVGYLLEKLNGVDMATMAKEKVWKHIPGLNFHYRPVLCDTQGALNPKIAATEICPWRGWLQGQVHDDNVWSMGGISPHSGVFGSIMDVALWVEALINGRVASYSTVAQFFNPVPLKSGVSSGRGIGFDLVLPGGTGTTAYSFTPGSVGHLGYTGTSVWFDLTTGDYACLLTNRVHPSRNDLRIKILRQKFNTIVRGMG